MTYVAHCTVEIHQSCCIRVQRLTICVGDIRTNAFIYGGPREFSSARANVNFSVKKDLRFEYDTTYLLVSPLKTCKFEGLIYHVFLCSARPFVAKAGGARLKV